jgi:hypothetical protein
MVSTSERRLTISSLARAWEATPRFFVTVVNRRAAARNYSTINRPVNFLWPNPEKTEH